MQHAANAAVRSLEFHCPLKVEKLSKESSLIARLLLEVHMEPRQATGLYDCFHTVLHAVIAHDRLLSHTGSKAVSESTFPEQLFGLRVRGMHLLRQAWAICYHQFISSSLQQHKSLKDGLNARLETETKWLHDGAQYVEEAVAVLNNLDVTHKQLLVTTQERFANRLAPWPHSADVLRAWSDAGFIRIPNHILLDLVVCRNDCGAVYHNIEPWMKPNDMHRRTTCIQSGAPSAETGTLHGITELLSARRQS